MSSVRVSWKGLSKEEKLIYKKKAEEKKDINFDPSTVSDDLRRERDRGYRKRQAIKKLINQDNQDSVQKDLLHMLEGKKRKVEAMLKLKESLMVEITSVDTEIRVVKSMISDHDDEEQRLKLDIKLFLNHHKVCKK